MILANDIRRLVLLRHAKAEPAGSVPDNLRPLALQGRRQATAVGALFSELAIAPQRVFVSSALRTRQTWELVSNGLDLDASFARVSDSLYGAGLTQVLDILSAAGEASTVLVVGHEPTMSSLAAHLASPQSDQDTYNKVRFGLPTSGFAILEGEQDWGSWGEGTARLVSTDRPEV